MNLRVAPHSRWVASFAFCLLAGAAAGQQVGSEFQVNTYTGGAQEKPSVAADSAGNFVVVWQSDGSDDTDTSSWSVQGQRFAADGNPAGLQFQVNTYTSFAQWQPSVGMAGAGSFLVVWSSLGSSGDDTSGFSIQEQPYNSSGVAQGSEYQLNQFTTNAQAFPTISAGGGDYYAVAWSSIGSYDSDNDSTSVQDRGLLGNVALGSQFQANSYTTSAQGYSAAAVDELGHFVVVWESYGSAETDGDLTSIHGRRHMPLDGGAIGEQFQINTYTTSHQGAPAVAMDPAGNFVVVWQSNGSAGGDEQAYSIQGQLFDDVASPIGDQFQVNTHATGAQTFPAVDMDPDGNFVVAWQSLGSPGTDQASWSVQGQRFAADGDRVGGQFQINTYTTNAQTYPSIAIDDQGGFVVAWQSAGSSFDDSLGTSIQAQRFAALLFGGATKAGFEGGTLCGWSVSVGGSDICEAP